MGFIEIALIVVCVLAIIRLVSQSKASGRPASKTTWMYGGILGFTLIRRIYRYMNNRKRRKY